MPSKVKSRYITNITIAVGAVIGIIVLLIVVGADTKKIAGDVISTRSELKTEIEQINKLAQLRDEAKLAEPKFVTLENILPKRDDLFSFPAQIEELATSHGLPSKFSFGNESEGSIQYSILVENGTFEKIFRFVKAIEEDRPFMSISRFGMVLGEVGYNGTIDGILFFDG